MRATLTCDPAKGPGFGIIDISGAAAAGEPSFVLHRASDGLSLSPNGWQEAEAALRPDAWDADGGSLRLAVGPAVVDNLDALDTYRLTLRGGSTGVCALTMQDIAYSSLNGGQGIVTTRPAPPPPPSPAPEPPAPEPEPPLDMAPPAADAPLEMAPSAPEPQPRPRGKGPLLSGVLLLLLLCGAAAWWFLLRPAEAPVAQVPAEAPTRNATVQPQASRTAPSSPAARPVPPPLTVAREHLKSGGDAAQSLKLAQGMTTPEAADAAFLLVEDAAQKGNVEAMFRLATFYDPVDTRPKGSIVVDPIQARLWYMKARDNGSAGAEAALTALRAWVETAAAKGDATAKAALTNWK